MSPESIALGEVMIPGELSEEQLNKLGKDLETDGFELLDDQRKQQIEKVKNSLIRKVQHGDIEDHFSLSKYLSSEIYKDYSNISKLFSAVEGITIEQFFILQKIEKVKEWLVYNRISLSEMAINLGYSSVQHLSGQFKKITGMTPGEFKKVGALHRKPLDKVNDKLNQ